MHFSGIVAVETSEIDGSATSLTDVQGEISQRIEAILDRYNENKHLTEKYCEGEDAWLVNPVGKFDYWKWGWDRNLLVGSNPFAMMYVPDGQYGQKLVPILSPGEACIARKSDVDFEAMGRQRVFDITEMWNEAQQRFNQTSYKDFDWLTQIYREESLTDVLRRAMVPTWWATIDADGFAEQPDDGDGWAKHCSHWFKSLHPDTIVAVINYHR